MERQGDPRLHDLHWTAEFDLRPPDLLRFGKIFHASEQFFQSGWFVESLATRTLVIFVIRTARNPFHSRPSLALTLTTISVVIFGTVLPFTALGKLIGFSPMPAGFLIFIALATGTYLVLVEMVKRRLMRRLLE